MNISKDSEESSSAALFYRSEEFTNICEAFSSAVREVFGEMGMLYSYLSGTFAYGGATKNKSDIDITVVFDDSIYLVEKSEFLAKVKIFVQLYREIHKTFSYKTDDVFPGEYLTLSQVEDAIRGRGFSVGPDGHLCLPTASDEYYLSNKETWFRAWLSSLAFSQFLSGDKDLLVNNKVSAWKTILLFLFSRDMSRRKRDEQGVLDFILENTNKWESIGVTNRYIYFKEAEMSFVKMAFSQLALEGFLVKDWPGAFSLNVPQLVRWEWEFVDVLQSQKIRRSDILFDE